MQLHIIQRRILQRVVLGHGRFSELMPDGLESNLFQYHLARLRAEKLIVKQDGRYELTPLGYQVAEKWSTSTMSVRLQPSVVVMNVVYVATDTVLVVRRHKQPYIETLSPPFGKVHYGERLLDAAIRDRAEKLLDVDFVTAPRFSHMAEVFVDGLHTIFYVYTSSAKLVQLTEKVELWPLPQVASDENAMPGLEDILRELSK